LWQIGLTPRSVADVDQGETAVHTLAAILLVDRAVSILLIDVPRVMVGKVSTVRDAFPIATVAILMVVVLIVMIVVGVSVPIVRVLIVVISAMVVVLTVLSVISVLLILVSVALTASVRGVLIGILATVASQDATTAEAQDAISEIRSAAAHLVRATNTPHPTEMNQLSPPAYQLKNSIKMRCVPWQRFRGSTATLSLDTLLWPVS
jgi:hypothetical protein